MNPLYGVLKIRPGEARLVLSLAVLYFSLGIAFVLTQAAAFALFLTKYSASTLPLAYMAIAVVLSPVTFAYLKLADRLALPRLLTLNLGVLLIVSLVLRLGLAVHNAGWVVFVLPIWFQGIVNLGNLAFWTLTGRVFDVREGKRLFGLVGAGNWLAAIAGGFLTGPLVVLFGTANLLAVAAVALAVALVLQGALLRSCADRLVVSRGGDRPRDQGASRRVPRNRYVLLIFALVLFWWLGFYVIDNIFYIRASAQFPTAGRLASAVGILYGCQGVLALVTTTLGTSRLLGRYGLRGGLLVMPSVCAASIGALAFGGTLGAATSVLFLMSALAKLVSVALGFSLEQASFVILYQPLPPEQRLRLQTTAEGIVQPIAVGIAGAMLLVLHRLLSFSSVQLSYLFLLIVSVWIAVVLAIVREYPKALGRALASRRLGGASLAPIDSTRRRVLEAALHDRHPGVALYALSLLADDDPSALMAAAPVVLAHPMPEVRREVLERIEHAGASADCDAVRHCAENDPSPIVRAAALRALAALYCAAVFQEIARSMDDADAEVRRGAMAGLLLYGGTEGAIAAGQKLHGLVSSASPLDRALAAEVLGDVGVRSSHQPLLMLMDDADADVRWKALAAAGKVRHAALWPRVVARISDPSPRVRDAASLALVSGGTEVVPAIAPALQRLGAEHRAERLRLVRICGRVGGMAAIDLLCKEADSSDAGTRLQILEALSACGYHASARDAASVWQRVRREVAEAAASLAALGDIGSDYDTALLSGAIALQVEGARDRAVILLSFVLPAQPILSARAALKLGAGTLRSYAVEVIDSLLPSEWKRRVLPLLEGVPPEVQLRRLAAEFPQERMSREKRVIEIIAGLGTGRDAWTRACALHVAGCSGQLSAAPAITASCGAPDPVVRETARFALAQLQAEAADRGARTSVGTHGAAVEAARPGKEGAEAVFSTVERVIILKSIGMFAQSPDDVLVDVAGIVGEVHLAAGSSIFEKGDQGSSMYIIVSGRVRVHDGNHTLSELAERDVFGEMALLDPEPRVASVTAVEDTVALRSGSRRVLRSDGRPERGGARCDCRSHRSFARARARRRQSGRSGT